MENKGIDTRAHYIAVTGIIMKDGKYLIAKRAPSEKLMPCLWTVPGGKLEMSDYIDKEKDTSVHWYNIIEDVMRREVREETGIEVKNLNYLTSMVFIRPDGIPMVILSLYADHHKGKVKLSDELTEYAWVTLDEAKKYDFIEGIYEELEMLDKKLKGEKVESWVKV